MLHQLSADYYPAVLRTPQKISTRDDNQEIAARERKEHKENTRG